MQKRAIVLTTDEWDRVIEFLDSGQFHPDRIHILQRISTQLAGGEIIGQMTLVPDKDNPNKMVVSRE